MTLHFYENTIESLFDKSKPMSPIGTTIVEGNILPEIGDIVIIRNKNYKITQRGFNMDTKICDVFYSVVLTDLANIFPNL